MYLANMLWEPDDLCVWVDLVLVGLLAMALMSAGSVDWVLEELERENRRNSRKPDIEEFRLCRSEPFVALDGLPPVNALSLFMKESRLLVPFTGSWTGSGLGCSEIPGSDRLTSISSFIWKALSSCFTLSSE